MEQLSSEQKKDLKVLVSFISIHCHSKHREQIPVSLPGEVSALFRKGVSLCPECLGLLEHAMLKRRKCPLDPKPSCKHCRIHCYSREYLEKIKHIMAFSGRRMIMRGRLDYLWHYFF